MKDKSTTRPLMYAIQGHDVVAGTIDKVHAYWRATKNERGITVSVGTTTAAANGGLWTAMHLSDAQANELYDLLGKAIAARERSNKRKAKATR